MSERTLAWPWSGGPASLASGYKINYWARQVLRWNRAQQFATTGSAYSAGVRRVANSGSGGSDCIDAGAGNDEVTTTTGDDTIDAGAGNNIVSAGGGGDTVTTGTGNDIVDCGAGTGAAHAGAGNNTNVGKRCELFAA
jgi:Ca2+-binding RTX toxin-like protein